jgi:hypothetical protein
MSEATAGPVGRLRSAVRLDGAGAGAGHVPAATEGCVSTRGVLAAWAAAAPLAGGLMLRLRDA